MPFFKKPSRTQPLSATWESCTLLLWLSVTCFKTTRSLQIMFTNGIILQETFERFIKTRDSNTRLYTVSSFLSSYIESYYQMIKSTWVHSAFLDVINTLTDFMITLKWIPRLGMFLIYFLDIHSFGIYKSNISNNIMRSCVISYSSQLSALTSGWFLLGPCLTNARLDTGSVTPGTFLTCGLLSGQGLNTSISDREVARWQCCYNVPIHF